MYNEIGINGDIHTILYPINHGIFRFVGFDVISPFIVWSASRISDERRQGYLQEYAQRLLTINQIPAIAYPALADFDENFQLKSTNFQET